MEADISRLESGLAGAEFRISTLEDLFVGKVRQEINIPLVDGFAQLFEVIAAPLGIFATEASHPPYPFFLTVTNDVSGYKYSVGKGSIINGTNGGPFKISTLEEPKSIGAEKFIVAEATVTSNPFKITDDGFTLKEVDANDTNEVQLEEGKQTKLRLLVGKVAQDPESTELSLIAVQGVTTSFKTGVSFHNGVPVYVLHAAATHQSLLTLPAPEPSSPPPLNNMFGRVHDIPLGQYMHNPGNSFYSGVLLGKKWTGGVGSFGVPSQPGWLVVGDNVGQNAGDGTVVTYPEYTMPRNLPEWVNGYNPSSHPEWLGNYNIGQPRYLLGDGVNSVGPYTLHEILLVYAVVRRHVPSGSDNSNSDSPIYGGVYSGPVGLPYSENEPYWLFNPSIKNAGSSKVGYNYIRPPTANGSDNKFYVAVDVDSLEDYYLVGPHARRYYNYYEIFIEGLGYTVRGYDYTGGNPAVMLNPVKVVAPPGEIGEGATLITCGGSFSTGSVTKNFTLHGWQLEPEWTPEEMPEWATINPPTSVSINATEFWPYENADGSPVYDTSTGNLIAPPIP